MDNDVKVPSVISYSPCSEADEQQFGSSLSPEAVAMINTKLELDVQDTRLDELDLILQVLEGVKDLKFDNVKRAQGLPGYTWKAPQKIVADYLEKAFVHFKRATDYLAGIKNRIPVDVIITVPVQWSYRAKNSTFKAIREAGFNESAFPRLERYVMVTEPEAAALYTARYLKEMEDEDLRVKDCFILCDAGGGTVDVVAYKVKETSPGLELQQMTIPTGKKCGASFVDQTFRNWLYDQIGEDNYNELDPRSDSERISAHATEGGQMRLLMQAFDPHKKAFKGSSADMHIPLPEPLDTLNIPGIVEDGELLVTNDDMRSFFGECIDEVIELIQGQIAQVDKKNNRVKTIFLIGGFSESEYLQEELAYSLRLRKIRLRRPSTSWSAVVRGAVLYGMESTNRTDQTRMIPCPRNYGLVMNHSYSQRTHGAQEVVRNEFTNQAMVRSQFDWFLMKGDLLLPNDSRTIEKNVVCYFHENAPKVCTLRLYEYLDDDLPEQYENAQEGYTSGQACRRSFTYRQCILRTAAESRDRALLL
ncbi:hypothetical protein BCR34DRAFT_253204 [Clohesyomyces aquaticus]|uniref:Actin-like ATPase domain-containing protein n=1 Tax=Clohesyomyces aquaticus TaxID=1231657 RepID=A0A1Y1ZUG9_9PLEO|nr:hypothetical protein BCR34DRAFT_253204 [Clohesyomyces aquaticus]